MQIKAGDTVVIIAGKDKLTKDKKGNLIPTTGKVLKVFPKENKVLVEGVNKVKKHVKPNGQDQTGGIIDKEASIHVSNVMPYCSTCKKGVRVAHTIENGKKTRVCRKCGKAL